MHCRPARRILHYSWRRDDLERDVGGVGPAPVTARWAAAPFDGAIRARLRPAAAARRLVGRRALRHRALALVGFLWFVWRVPAEEVRRTAMRTASLRSPAARRASPTRSSCWRRAAASGCSSAAPTGRPAGKRFRGSIRSSSAGCAAASISTARSIPSAMRSRPGAGPTEARLPLADRGDVELSHAARARRDRASASRRCAGAFPGGDRSAARRALVVERRQRRG